MRINIIVFTCLKVDNALNSTLHWRRQLWTLGHTSPSTFTCLIFQVTLELHKLVTFDSMWLPVQ